MVKNNWTSTLRYLVYAGQLGLSLVLPIIACTGGAWWLCGRYDLPSFVILIGMAVGILGAGVCFMRFANMMQCASQKKTENKE